MMPIAITPAKNDEIGISLKDVFSLPRTVMDAYELGLLLNNRIYQHLDPLSHQSTQADIIKFLDITSTCQQQESDLFTAGINNKANSRLREFSKYKDFVPEEDCTDDERFVAIKVLIEKSLDDIDSWIELIDELVVLKGKNRNNLYSAWLDLRDCCAHFYRKLALFYPEGNLRHAFFKMAHILDENQELIGNMLF